MNNKLLVKLSIQVVSIFSIITSLISLVSTFYSRILLAYLYSDVNLKAVQLWQALLTLSTPHIITLAIAIIMLVYSKNIIIKKDQQEQDKGEKKTKLLVDIKLIILFVSLLLVLDSIFRITNTIGSTVYSYLSMQTTMSANIKQLAKNSILRAYIKSIVTNIPLDCLYVVELIIGLRYFIKQKNILKSSEMIPIEGKES